jgi:predicted Rossmann fold nucleotide-binding protein DprA/Smf involved in DNA uptake
LGDLFEQALAHERAHRQRGDSIVPRARNGDALTSHEAAERAKAFAQDHRASILGVMWRPMTADAVARVTGLSIEQVCRRLPEMEREGTVRLTGNTVKGANGSNFREWERRSAA